MQIKKVINLIGQIVFFYVFAVGCNTLINRFEMKFTNISPIVWIIFFVGVGIWFLISQVVRPFVEGSRGETENGKSNKKH